MLLLDIVSAGGGGPEFDLGRSQTVWLDRELDAARREDAYPPVVLMHAFPADLAYDGSAIADRFARAGVTIVDTGHTHYNEVLNDGQVIYTAARSTAQVEEEREDAFGTAFVAVDGDQGELPIPQDRRRLAFRDDHLAGGSPAPGGACPRSTARAGWRCAPRCSAPGAGRR